jgi:hypothetical protein
MGTRRVRARLGFVAPGMGHFRAQELFCLFTILFALKILSVLLVYSWKLQ